MVSKAQERRDKKKKAKQQLEDPQPSGSAPTSNNDNLAIRPKTSDAVGNENSATQPEASSSQAHGAQSGEAPKMKRQAPSTKTNNSDLRKVNAPTLEASEPGEPTLSEAIPLATELKRTPPKFLSNKAGVPEGQASRPAFGVPTTKVWSNYVCIELQVNVQIYIYEVEGMDQTWTRPKKKVMIERFMNKCNLLAQNSDHFVTDFNKRIYAFKDLSELDDSSIADEDQTIAVVSVDDHNPKTQISVKRQLSLIYKKKASLKNFRDFCLGNATTNRPDAEVIPALNVLIREAIKSKSSNKTFLIGSNRVYAKNGWTELGGQSKKVTIRGYAYGVQAGMDCVLLNINPITTTFHKPMFVSEYIMDGHGNPSRTLQVDLKGVRVWLELERMHAKVEHDHSDNLDSPERRIKTIAECGERAGKQIAYGETTVWDHMSKFYGGRTKGNENSVCVNLGGKGDKAQWFLAEDLRIIPYQPFRGDTSHLASEIIKTACKVPLHNRQLIISDFMSSLDMNNQSEKHYPGHFQGFTIYSALVQSHAHLATTPSIQYGSKNDTVNPDQGKWSLGNSKFFNNSRAFSGHAFFLIASSIKCDRTLLGRCLKFLNNECSATGVQGLKKMEALDAANSATVTSFETADLTKQILGAKNQGAALVVLILPQNSKTEMGNYAAFKVVCDQSVGVKSLCLYHQKIQGYLSEGSAGDIKVGSKFSGYVNNVAMKLNIRLGNVNHIANPTSLQVNIPNFKADEHIMLLGADVVHPGQAAYRGVPSIAAVVGTIDRDLVKYRGSGRRQESAEEMITHMEEMARERLRAYHKERRVLPTRIIYYRDGIDNGRFDRVLNEETRAIRAAFDALVAERLQTTKKPLKITTIIVSKRHHTRFYPTSGSVQTKPTGNCLPGTVVDSGVTLPYNYDFFLISQNAIKGTARPTHYIVLQDEIGFKDPQMLHNLTNILCYTYARATTAVSYVPPAYYADHLCERVKQYLRPLFEDQSLADTEEDKALTAMSDKLWALNGRPEGKGNPWNAALDDTMFWL